MFVTNVPTFGGVMFLPQMPTGKSVAKGICY